MATRTLKNNQTIERKIALSFDIEDLNNIKQFGLGDDQFSETSVDHITQSTIHLLEMLKAKDITATFFFVGDVIQKYPTLANEVKNTQHEIGCHSMTHKVPQVDSNPAARQSWKLEQSRAKTFLEDFFCRSIVGYRAPSAYFYDWMIDELIDVGFSYDSSMSINDIYSKSNFTVNNNDNRPFLLPSNRTKHLVELPFNTLNIMNFNLPASGAFFYRALGNYYAELALRSTLKKSDASFYLHPIDFCTADFDYKMTARDRVYWVGRGDKLFNKFDKLLTKFDNRWTSCRAIYDRFMNNKI